MAQGMGADPVSAVAGAVEAVANAASNLGDIFFGGRRRREQNQGEWINPTDFEYLILGGLFLLVIVLVVVAAKKG